MTAPLTKRPISASINDMKQNQNGIEEQALKPLFALPEHERLPYLSITFWLICFAAAGSTFFGDKISPGLVRKP